MSDKYLNKYRISSARASWWDYGNQAMYFITICTHQRQHFFGEIRDGEMILSNIGKIVDHEWQQTTALRADMNLMLANYVIMPNHFHAIVGIGENEYNRDGGGDDGDGGRDALQCVSTTTTTDGTEPKNKFGPQRKNLASVIRGFKGSVTRNARLIDAEFKWQSRFYDQIIQDQPSCERIKTYIEDNPRNWENDSFF